MVSVLERTSNYAKRKNQIPYHPRLIKDIKKLNEVEIGPNFEEINLHMEE